MTRINIDNLSGGLSLVDPSNLKDNQFEVLKNMFYNDDKRIQTRRGITTFGNAIGSNPITSYFFFQRDDTGARIALCTSGTVMYKYNEGTENWDSLQTGLTQYEADGTTLTRWSFVGYKNNIYMCNGVDCYAKYDGTTYSELGTSSVGTSTFDNTTDIVTKTTHGLVENSSVKFTNSGGALPTGITSGRWYYVKYIDADTFQISLTPSGTAVNFTTNGTGTTTAFTTSQPRVRYLQYMQDRVMGAGDDANPSTLYYTAALPSNANTITTASLVVGGDELGRINGLKEEGSVILVFKNKKIYSISTSANSSTAIDAQNGGYSHRTIHNVENGVLYFNDSGIDYLKQRSGVSGGAGLQTEPLTDDLSSLIADITPYSYNYSCGTYIPSISNYYFSFDTGSDRVPDKTLVRSSLTGTWSQYEYPSMHDYGYYIDSDGVYHYLIASANGGQMYEIEKGFNDNGTGISTELKTKRFDFGDSSVWKIYDTIDIIGLKNEGSEITVEIIVDGDVVSSATLDDTFADLDNTVRTIGAYPIGADTIGGGAGTGEEIDLYPYLIRIPAFNSGTNIQIRMYSEDNPNVWTLDKIRINYQQQALDLFPQANIA